MLSHPPFDHRHSKRAGVVEYIMLAQQGERCGGIRQHLSADESTQDGLPLAAGIVPHLGEVGVTRLQGASDGYLNSLKCSLGAPLLIEMLDQLKGHRLSEEGLAVGGGVQRFQGSRGVGHVEVRNWPSEQGEYFVIGEE